MDIDDNVRQYILTMLWAEDDDSDESGDNPLDASFGPDDLSPESLARCEADCREFARRAGDMLREHPDPTMWGHDFWLTRKGHGAGFWDGDWPINGDALTALAKEFGEVWPTVGDDGQVWL